MPTTTNWEALETEYLIGEISYAALAVKHEVSRRQLEKQAKEREWGRKRAEWRGKTAVKARQKCTDETVEIHVLLYRIWRELLTRYLDALGKAGLEVDADEVRGWTKMLMADLAQKPVAAGHGLDDVGQMADAELDRILADSR